MDSFSSNMVNLNEPREVPEGLTQVLPRSHQEDGRMLSPDVVDRIHELSKSGSGVKRIAKQLLISRNTVRRYLAGGKPGRQVRLKTRRLDDARLQTIHSLYQTVAEGNAVVVQQELARQGVTVNLRTIQRAVAPLRQDKKAKLLATDRFETAPGKQLQIDFGQKRVLINNEYIVVHLMSCVLGFSRRCYCQAFLAERQDDWFEGIDNAFRWFGGVTEEILCDNTSPLVQSHNVATGEVVFHPGFSIFCRDRGVVPKACKPRRARTKGKIERTVGYVKHNALAGRTFPSFAALQNHLRTWIVEVADQRIHRTTLEKPIVRFEREKKALGAFPDRPLAVRTRRLKRNVSIDCFVDIDTIRYSVPYRFIKRKVDVVLGLDRVEVWVGSDLVASHERAFEPHSWVRDPAHFEGISRSSEATVAVPPRSIDSGPSIVRPLSVYAAMVEGGRP